ncbi:hypothetical protein OL239_06875 [Arthrobacter sp. ATA002]|uniref:hypothetical protein n=1 Tax=Arthrobacter sp. ATA002 TaxID=2991715 RepID=UPI0022A7E12E|nr:hypothetical protein [Arthrobacter sp. ATA002]WAP52869.1 hypothetical protein OL239_06875 [Arthrobacter sp. ATA002]
MSEAGTVWKLEHASLSAYLDDHLLAAETGVRLFSAARRTWAGSKYEQTFADLENEISGERDELEQLIITLGYRRSKFKHLVATAGAVTGRLGPINPLSTGGGTTGQFELETLQSIVRAKECLYRTLLSLSAHDHRFNPARLREMIDMAGRQQDAVARVMEETAPARFLTGQVR